MDEKPKDLPEDFFKGIENFTDRLWKSCKEFVARDKEERRLRGEPERPNTISLREVEEKTREVMVKWNKGAFMRNMARIDAGISLYKTYGDAIQSFPFEEVVKMVDEETERIIKERVDGKGT